MKKDEFYFGLILIVCIFTILSLNWRITDCHKEQMQEIQELKILIQERAVKDTLYWEHLENCAFIHKDSIGVGYQGYLYDKYHRKYIKK